MQRSFTIIEGEGKGQTKPFTSALMIVGRAAEAEIRLEDPSNKVSRRHLQVRVEAGVVFVENMSPYGALLNGKAITSAVSLEAGDVLKVGEITMRYEEKADAEKVPGARDSTGRGGDIDPKSVELDATRVAGPEVMAAREQRRNEPDDGEGTRVAEEDKTRMMDADEIGKFKAAAVSVAGVKTTAPKSNAGLIAVVLLVVAVAGGAWFLHQRGGSGVDAGGTNLFKDPLYLYSFSYPLSWAKLQDTSEAIIFGYGKDGDADMARLLMYHDKQPDYTLTGLADGFQQYQDTMKKRIKSFELTGQDRQTSGGATFILFGFRGTGVQGRGIYLLDEDTRLVMYCLCPVGVYEQYRPMFTTILKSFQLNGDRPQEFIDYDMPDSGMVALASSSPADLSRMLHDHLDSGADLLKSRMLRPENLNKAMMEYRQALRLAMAGPERLPEWRPAAEGLSESTRLFHQELDAARLKVKIALKEGNRDTAYWSAQQMLEMVADKTDPAYFEAYSLFQTLNKGHR